MPCHSTPGMLTKPICLTLCRRVMTLTSLQRIPSCFPSWTTRVCYRIWRHTGACIQSQTATALTGRSRPRFQQFQPPFSACFSNLLSCADAEEKMHGLVKTIVSEGAIDQNMLRERLDIDVLKVRAPIIPAHGRFSFFFFFCVGTFCVCV